jgi:hypothetical protein
MTLASSVLPHDLFQEARSYYLNLANHNSVTLTKDINSGQVAATLDLLSQNKVSIGLLSIIGCLPIFFMKICLDMADRANYIQSKQSVIYPKLSAGMHMFQPL